ncbi:hypothetical protein J2853_000074 [Streptosporangium lutulentum]|uniref:Uncharacterized protein n=1 Tax=Streptosporangium lutulentum TaxID=1461250 RepID=A0ABT9Q299_9ACTN|nr:hypothetical protein [Streptosporangium lutulentum]
MNVSRRESRRGAGDGGAVNAGHLRGVGDGDAVAARS